MTKESKPVTSPEIPPVDKDEPRWRPKDYKDYKNLIKTGIPKHKAALSVVSKWSWKKRLLIWGGASTLGYLAFTGELPKAHTAVIEATPKIVRGVRSAVDGIDSTIGKTISGIGNCVERFADWRQGINNPNKPCTIGHSSGAYNKDTTPNLEQIKRNVFGKSTCEFTNQGEKIFNFMSEDPNMNPAGKIPETNEECESIKNQYREAAKAKARQKAKAK